MIRGLLVFSAATLLMAAAPARAADPPDRYLAFRGGLSSGQVVETPEMWFYEEYRRDYHDPHMMVRRNAEFRAQQRRHRLAALKWFGFSNSRPRASSDPLHNDYSPYWAGNNAHYPYRWQGTGSPWLTMRSERGEAGNY